MELSLNGLALIEDLEKKENQMYHDQVGLPTIGYGHLLTKSELTSGKIVIGVISFPWAEGLSDAAVDALLKQDTELTVERVNQLVTVELTQGQFDSLVSFAFNVGLEAFANSTLLKDVNASNFGDVPTQFRRWIYAKKVVVQDLIERREKEIQRWQVPN